MKKKFDFGRPNLKTETTFCHQLSKKNDGLDTCFTGISFSGEFGANFENSVIFAHFWPSSPYKTPKSKTYGANGQYVSKNSELVFGVLIHGDNRISKAGSKKGIIHFEEHPICIKI